MRIGAVFEANAAAFYRGVYPLQAMERRGHDIVWPENDTGNPKLSQISHCDVVFVYRRHEEGVRQLLRSLASRGVGIVWDNDDDLSAIPKHSPTYREVGALRAQKRFSETVKTARLAHVVTLTTEVLRDRYARHGLERVEAIDNMLQRRTKRRLQKHDGIVVGWIAGMEHLADAALLEIPAAIKQLQEVHADVHVHCVGADLKLESRYTHQPSLHFDRLPDAMARFDVGLAPLAANAFNEARSSIKVKEYAASGVPWLASPVAPYSRLGESQGGFLVPDTGWFEALDRLVRDRRARKRLSKSGTKWAKTQTVDAVADQWETVFAEASERARSGIRQRAGAVARAAR
jgi:glycosyltransferase involved in cell wall biosynthesis